MHCTSFRKLNIVLSYCSHLIPATSLLETSYSSIHPVQDEIRVHKRQSSFFIYSVQNKSTKNTLRCVLAVFQRLFILGDPGAASRDEGIFMGESLHCCERWPNYLINSVHKTLTKHSFLLPSDAVPQFR